MSGTPPAPDNLTVPISRRDLWIDLVWLTILAGWCTTWCVTAAAKTGATFDEPFYMEAGLENWRSGKPAKTSTNGVMFLPVKVATAPLYAQENRTGKELSHAEAIALLPRARMMTLGWLGILILTAMRLGKFAGGPWAGRLAAGLIAADPTFLAHSSLATTDISVTATLMALTLYASTGQGRGWLQRIVLPGFCFGIAVMCKLSALLYGGYILVALEVMYRLASGELAKPAGAGLGAWGLKVAKTVTRSVLAVAAIIAVGIGLAILVTGIPDQGTRPMAEVAKSIPRSEPLKPRYDRFAEEYDQVPYAVVAFAFQWWHNSSGRPAFLNGTYYPEGCWFHFPVLMAMKIPLPVMVLGLAALLRFRRAFNPFMVVALVLAFVTLTAKLQIGVRLVLPVIAMGYVAVAVGVVRGFGRCGAWGGLVAVALITATSLWVWPYGLGYLNQLAGGPQAAPDRVSDSNLDWGQGIPDLLEWHKANGEPEIALWYFGTDPLAWKPPFSPIAPEKAAIANGDDLRQFVGPRILAVGTTVISLHPDAPPSKRAILEYLRTVKPLARTPTFVIYDFRNPPGPQPK